MYRGLINSLTSASSLTTSTARASIAQLRLSRPLPRGLTTMSASPYLTPTYDNALHLLSLLQSNKTIINLFAASPNTADINASAIPEMKAWLSRAGYSPSDLAKLRCVHVAGTKGKGSVSTLTASVLRQYPDVAGKVGTYTSPHLVSVRERICLDGEAISRDRFVTYFYELWNRLSEAARGEGCEVPEGDELGADGPSTKPFYFRFLTLLAFHAFLREGVKSAVIECGIGGEYDSTNVLPPEAVTVSAVTQLGIDHVNMLGDTVQKIAWHKAGIFKRDVPAYTYQVPKTEDGTPNALDVMRDRAAEKGTTLTSLDDSDLQEWGGVQDANLEGAFQQGNMLLATAVSRQHLQTLGHKFDTETFENGRQRLPKSFKAIPEPIKDGLRTAQLRGRCETIPQDHISWYLDGAHTEDSLVQVGKWFATKLSGTDSIRVLIFNQQDRDSTKLLQTLLHTLEKETSTLGREIFHYAFCSTNDLESSSAEPDMAVQRRNCEVVSQFCSSTTATPVGSVSSALDMVQNLTSGSKSRDGFKILVLVTGSFNLVGPALRLLEPDSEL